MGYVAKLIKGNYSLDLSSGRYKLADDFIPPTTQEEIQTAGGTATNRFGGARRVGIVATNSELNFRVHINGGSSAEIEQAIRDIDKFLRQAGDESEPLYFAWRPDNNVPAEPIWGQFGAYLKCEVVFGSVYKPMEFGVAAIREKRLPGIEVAMEIKPFARGPMQRLGVAKGFIWENNIFSDDGLSAGLHIGAGNSSRTNQHTNPVFGHSTYNNGWTAGANLAVSQNTDKRYKLFGNNSAKVTSRGTTLNTFTQSLNLSDPGGSSFSLSYYVKLPDSSTISSTQVEISYNGSTQTTTYTQASSGWWRISATVTASGGAAATGVIVKNGYTIYIDGAQAWFSVLVPFFYGDMLGCSWSSTAHASTSIAATAFLKMPATQQIDIGGGTMRIVWRADNANTAYSTNSYLMLNQTSNFGLYFDSTNDRFVFTDGTNSANGATRTFAANDKFIIHCTWSKTNGIKLYVNGAADGSGNATYTPPTLGAANFLGSDATPANHIGGTFKGLAFYSHEMTAAQVLADYNNAVQLVTDNQMLEPIPYRWNKDGDGIVDNCIEGSTYHNYIVCGGIPGSVPAETQIVIDVATMGSETKMVIALADLDQWIDPDGNFWRDASGTATTSADVGSAVRTETVNTTNVFVTALTDIDSFTALEGRSLALVSRVRDAGANLTFGTYWDLIGSNTVLTDFKAISANSTSKVFIADNILMPTKRDLLAHQESSFMILDDQFDIGPVFVRTTAGSADIKVDYVFLMPRPFLELTYSGLTTSDYFLINGREAFVIQASGDQFVFTGRPTTIGKDPIELVPNKTNILFTILGSDGEANTITRTLSYNSIDVIPRYAIA